MSAQLIALGQKAKACAPFLLAAGTEEKNRALLAIAEGLLDEQAAILEANERDCANGLEAGLSTSLVDRLRLDSARIEAICEGVRQVAALPAPIGEVAGMRRLPNGLLVGQKRVPFGVVGLICEARPNVTVDAAALCLKTSNCIIVRGGKEAIFSNIALCAAMRRALEACGFPADCIQLIEDTSRDTATDFMRLNGYLDVLIPRGGAGLIASVVQNATVPVIETGTGNCHVYVDSGADLVMAQSIIVNAKTTRVSVCNSAESLLVAESEAAAFLPAACAALAEKGVEIRGCEKTRALYPQAKAATEADHAAEFLDLILSVKVLPDVDAAISHINRYGTHHSDAIVTCDYARAQRFLDRVDSAAVYVNASTRFTDGFEFGLGAEMGISTQKLHARGPMGLHAMTAGKFIIYGQGQIR